MESKNKIKSNVQQLNGSSKTKKDKSSEKVVEKTTKSENKSKGKKKDKIEPGAAIRLLGNRSVHHVNVDDFSKVSQLVKQQQNAGNLMTSVDLNKFSDQSILAFVNYIQTREIKSSLTYYAITELITLARTFQMKDLKNNLEDSLIDASKNSEADLLQTLIICDVTHISPETERVLQTSAIENIQKIVTLPDFHKMPFQQLFQILSSCELNISNEMYVADVLLLWLSGQTNASVYAPALLSCIRTKYLSPVDKTLIIERISMWNMPDKVVRLARNTFESSNSQRICVDPTHLKKNMIRCAPPGSLSSFGAHSSLPLSRPNFSIKMKKSKEAKMVEKFDPSAEPKVTDLIKVAPSEKQKGKAKLKVADKSKSAKAKPAAGKSKCVCVEFLKRKLAARKNQGKGKRPNDSKKTASKTSSVKFETKSSEKSMSSKVTKTKSDTKAKVPSKNSSAEKLSSSASRSEMSMSKRRNQKRDKINSAMKTVKSDPKLKAADKSKSASRKSEKSGTL